LFDVVKRTELLNELISVHWCRQSYKKRALIQHALGRRHIAQTGSGSASDTGTAHARRGGNCAQLVRGHVVD